MALKTLPKGNPPGERQAQTELRIEEIAATLRGGSFRTGVTLREFAARWGVSMDTVHGLSAQASKRVKAEVTDPDRVAAKGFAMLESIADEARHACDERGNNAGHLAIAVKAVDTWLVRSGVAAPTKAAVSVSGDLSALTDEQIEAREREVLARIAARHAAKGSKT